MPFTKVSEDLMSYFFDVYEKYDYNKTKYKQKEMDNIFKKFYYELIVSKNIYKKYYKHKIRKKVKEIETIFDIPGIDLINSDYVDDSISDYIKSNMTGLLEVNFKIQNTDIICYFSIFSKRNFSDLKRFDIYIKNIYIFLTFLFSFMKIKKPNTMSYYFYLSKFKKNLPKNRFSVLGPINSNSGLTYGCSNDGNTLIFRQEEWFKVFIHETFHSLCLDFNTLHCKDFNNKFKKLINIESKLNLYESYTEFWATIFNSVYIAFELLEDSVDEKKFLLYLDFILHFEKIFSLFQCVKVLDYMGLTYENLIIKNEINDSLRSLYYKEDTNIFSYYIGKCLLLYYKEDFLLWCKKNNNEVIFNFTKSNKNLNLFLKFLEKNLVLKNMRKDLEKSLLHLNNLKKKNTYPISNSLTKTLRMSITEMF